MKALFAVAVGLALASTASAQNWVESPDAGDVPGTAQVPAGAGPLLTISGTIAANADADMYCITIPTPGGFGASTCGGATIDTQLWLFNANGAGVSFNDDDPAGCGLQSTLTGGFVPGGGQYYLAISSYSNDALNAGGQEIWLDTPFDTERAPDGAADTVVNRWNGGGFSSGAYRIDLQGVVYCGGPTPILDSTWGKIKNTYK
jgi:hypothetical protein